MKLKKYIEFIRESLKEDVESLKFWKVNEDEIRDALIDLTDGGYLVTVTFGFVENKTIHHYNRPSEKKEIFTEKITAGETVRPAYWIQIIEGKRTSTEDLSDSIRFLVSLLSSEAGADSTFHDREGAIGDLEGIKIEGGLFYTDNWNSGEPETLSVESYIAVFAKQREGVKITQKDLVEFYSWEDSIEDGNRIFAELDTEDMVDGILSRGSDYKEILIKGEESMWDHYDMSYYEPDINSVFQYTLENGTKELLIKALIKEFGGFEELKSKLEGEMIGIHTSTEDTLVKFLVEERFNKELIDLIKSEFSDSKVWREVTGTVADWEQSAHVLENWKEIVEEFDEIIEDELGKFKKVEREITKYYFHNNERKEYKADVTFYRIPFDNAWIEDTDAEYLHNRSLNSIFKDWMSEQNFNREMNPRLSDYGSADDKKMNEDIRRYLTRYLAK